mgnify:CR=1 FL=1
MEYKDISALLTPGQRDYLLGNSDIDAGSANERATRARIRDRLTQGVGDLAILQANLESRDVEQAFDPIDFNDVEPALALILDGVSRVSKYQHGTSDGQDPDDEVKDMFAAFYAGALKSMYVKRGIEVENITVDVDIELGSNLGEISKDNLSEMPSKRLIQLLEAGEIDRYEFIEALESVEDELEFESGEDERS